MPLEKSTSKQAFSRNIERERAAGKPEAQSVAIAYSEKKEAEKRDRKEDMRHDGKVQFPAESGHHVGPSSAELNDSFRQQVSKMMAESSASKFLRGK